MKKLTKKTAESVKGGVDVPSSAITITKAPGSYTATTPR